MQKYGFCFLNVMLLQFVWNVMAICQQHFGNPFAMFWQSVRSCRGPIYRTRVHEYPEIILRIYAVGVTIRIISAHQNHLGWLEKRVL